MEKKLLIVVFPLVLSSSIPISGIQLRKLLASFAISCFTGLIVCFLYACFRNWQEGYTAGYLYNAIFENIHPAGRHEYLNYWYFTYKLFSEPVGMHPVYFSMYLVFSACIYVVLWWKESVRHKILISLILTFHFFALLLLSSRTQLFCMVVLVSAFIIHQSWIKGRVLFGIGVLVLLLGAGLSFIFLNPVLQERIISSNVPGKHFSSNQFGEGGLSLRLYKWKYSAEAISQRPLVGYGTGDGQEALSEVYASHDFGIGIENNFNPHNQYLQSMLDTGILGLVCFLILLVVPLIRGITSRNVLLIIVVVLFLISCITESMLEVNKGVAFFACFCSLLLHTDICEHRNPIAGRFWERSTVS